MTAFLCVRVGRLRQSIRIAILLLALLIALGSSYRKNATCIEEMRALEMSLPCSVANTVSHQFIPPTLVPPRGDVLMRHPLSACCRPCTPNVDALTRSERTPCASMCREATPELLVRKAGSQRIWYEAVIHPLLQDNRGTFHQYTGANCSTACRKSRFQRRIHVL